MDKVELIPIKEIDHEQGPILHMLRSDSPHFRCFGEIYFSVINGGANKGWKRHLKMTQLIAVPMGQVEFALRDDRENSPTVGVVSRLVIGRPLNYFLLKIPPMVWYSFKGLGPNSSLIANCTDMPHDPTEVERRGFGEL